MTSLSSYPTTASEFLVSHKSNRYGSGDDDKCDERCCCLLVHSKSFNDTLTVWPQYRADDNFKVFYLDAEISVKELYKQMNYYFYTSYSRGIFHLSTSADSRQPTRRKQRRQSGLKTGVVDLRLKTGTRWP